MQKSQNFFFRHLPEQDKRGLQQGQTFPQIVTGVQGQNLILNPELLF